MQIGAIQNNNFSPNFSAKLDVKRINGMITDNEIHQLQEKAKGVGNADSLIYIILHYPYQRGIYRSIYHGVKMDVVTYHNGKFDSVELKKELDTEHGKYEHNFILDYENDTLKEEYRPFTIINEWLDHVFKPENLEKAEAPNPNFTQGVIKPWYKIPLKDPKPQS